MATAAGHTLILKALTMSDTTFGVSKSGRVVLPRAQVECCLEQLLRLGGATSAAASLKANIVPRLSVNLTILDEHNNEFFVTLKTWQNVVSGQHRPTFVLENTAAFMAVHPMKPGDILGICVTPDMRLQMRTDMRMNDVPTVGGGAGVGLKRKLSSSTASGNTGGNVDAMNTTTTAAAKRRGVISLKRNSSSIGPSTPAPSSPQQDPKVILTMDSINNNNNSNSAATGVRFSSVDVAAAAVLMAMSSDTSSSGFSLTTTTGEKATISSGLSGSSPSPNSAFEKVVPTTMTAAAAAAVVGESEMSNESQVIATTPQSAKIKSNTITTTTGTQQGRMGPRQGSLPPPPLPPPRSCTARPMISPFQEALLAYSLDNLEQLSRIPSHSTAEQEHEERINHHQQLYQASNSLPHTRPSRFMNCDLSHLNMGWGGQQHQQQEHQQQHQRHHDHSASMRPFVQSGASVWPLMMSQAAMVVANAMHNYRVVQQQHQEYRQEQQKNVRVVVHNHQQGVAIRTASPEVPHVSMARHQSMTVADSGIVGQGRSEIPVTASPVEGLLRHFVH